MAAAEKLEACEASIQHFRRQGNYIAGGDRKGKGEEQQIQKICRDTCKVANEHIKGMSSQVGCTIPASGAQPPFSQPYPRSCALTPTGNKNFVSRTLAKNL